MLLSECTLRDLELQKQDLIRTSDDDWKKSEHYKNRMVEIERCINLLVYKVIIKYAPISERYWSKDCDGLVRENEIRVTGCWFPFDSRWIVEKI